MISFEDIFINRATCLNNNPKLDYVDVFVRNNVEASGRLINIDNNDYCIVPKAEFSLIGTKIPFKNACRSLNQFLEYMKELEKSGCYYYQLSFGENRVGYEARVEFWKNSSFKPKVTICQSNIGTPVKKESTASEFTLSSFKDEAKDKKIVMNSPSAKYNGGTDFFSNHHSNGQDYGSNSFISSSADFQDRKSIVTPSSSYASIPSYLNSSTGYNSFGSSFNSSPEYSPQVSKPNVQQSTWTNREAESIFQKEPEHSNVSQKSSTSSPSSNIFQTSSRKKTPKTSEQYESPVVINRAPIRFDEKDESPQRDQGSLFEANQQKLRAIREKSEHEALKRKMSHMEKHHAVELKKKEEEVILLTLQLDQSIQTIEQLKEELEKQWNMISTLSDNLKKMEIKSLEEEKQRNLASDKKNLSPKHRTDYFKYSGWIVSLVVILSLLLFRPSPIFQ